ncbi:MAG TPA: HipA domain-containing protein [Steroidobacteraceae bacterium]|nr:HipA domain-containing protein [Steroidobacteraceae bacterium]
MKSNPSRFDNLWLFFLGDPATPRHIGELKYLQVSRGVSLTYAAGWLATGFRLSEDLPLTMNEASPREPGRAAGAVDDARPDRWGERVIQFVYRPARLSLMEYLYFAGDDRFGALGVSSSPDEYLPRATTALPRLEAAQALSDVVRKISAKETLSTQERAIAQAGGSLGGAKPKALISIDGEEWVIKFFAGEPIDRPLIEHASMTLALKAGIRAAETRVVDLAGEHAVVVRRFDREGKARLHSLSASTVLRALSPRQHPDLGYPALAQALRRFGETADGVNDRQMRELFRRMVFNILIDNTDDHEKNHSLLYLPASRAGKLHLAPAYDVLPTNSGQGHQEFTVGTEGRESTLRNAMSQCALFGLSNDEAAQAVLEIIAVVDGWKSHFESCGVTGADIDNLADRIDGEALLGQRRGFAPKDHATPIKRRPRRPF